MRIRTQASATARSRRTSRVRHMMAGVIAQYIQDLSDEGPSSHASAA